MKKFAIGMLSAMVVACFAVAAMAQRNPRGKTTLTLNGKTISVDYGRPALKGRTIDDPTLLGKLKAGGFWRMGDNTSTTFKTEGDLAFGDVTVPAGEYSIWMQRQADNSWKLLFDKQHGQSGEPVPNASECFASVPLQVSGPHDGRPQEMLTIALDSTKDDLGGWIDIQWGTLEARVFFAPK